jgi:hypothetical protein
MIAGKQAKIILEATTAHGGVRLAKTRVALLQDESPIVPSPHDLPSRYNPVPLLTFFAHCKLHALLSNEAPFQARSRSCKWAIQLYDLIKNCGKKQTCWLEKVFGSRRTAPHVCAVHRVITAFKDGREHVVALAATAPRPDEIELRLDGMPADGERGLREFLQRLAANGGIETSPPSLRHDTAPVAAPSAIDAGASVDRYSLPEQLQGMISLRFPKFNLAHNDFERECLKRLVATRKLDIKWLGTGMEYGAPILPDLLQTLVGSVSECDIALSIAMLDSDWEFVRHLRPDWPDGVRKSYDKLMALAALYREQQHTLKKRKVSIAVRTYQYIPNWHGLVIDDSQFYVGLCSWKESVPGSGKIALAGAENPYVVLCAENRGFESWLAAAFLGWFGYAFHWSANRRSNAQVCAQGPC